jgi:NYN domain/OST-HTH/LOTUS domain
MYKENRIVDSHSSVPNRQIAMLIDGDNAQPSLIEAMLAETGKYGLVTIRRIYGDWTSQNMKGWKDALQVHAIQPFQQFRYTIGKNATDSAMIIDAMDILYSGVVSGFCLVSSDSDYTRLATRIREKGLFVMGIGKRMTPRAFINACEIFVYTENLVGEPEQSRPEPSPKRRAVRVPRRAQQAPEPTVPSSPSQLLKRAFEMAVQEDGWAFLGTMGSRLRQLDPSFDPRTYGSRQLSTLIRTYPNIFEVKEVKTEEEGPAHVYVRLREQRLEISPSPIPPSELPIQ